MSARTHRPPRLDPLVRAARARKWRVNAPYRTDAGLWGAGWYSPTLLECGGLYCDTKAKAWAMLLACLKVALGKR